MNSDEVPVAQALEAPDLPNARNEATAPMYPREYNTFQETVEKARIGKISFDQEVIIEIENLADWKEFWRSDEFPEDVRCELRAIPFPAVIVFGPSSVTHEFLYHLFFTKPVPDRLQFLGRPSWTLTNGVKVPNGAFCDMKPPLPPSDRRTTWPTVMFEVTDLQGTSTLRAACNRWITESPPRCLLTVVGVDIQRDTGGDISHVDVITWRLIHQKEDFEEDNWVLMSPDPTTPWKVYAEEDIQRMYTANGPPVTKSFVLMYGDVLHNVLDPEEGRIAFEITTEEFKERLLFAEKLQQDNLQTELDFKCGKILWNEHATEADMEYNDRKRERQNRERERGPGE